MKRIIFIFCFLFSVYAFAIAADQWSDSLSSNIDFSLSNGVWAGYDSTDNQSYTMGTAHISGDQVYGTSTLNSNIYKLSDGKDKGAEPSADVPDNLSSNSAWEKL